jgi:hypothetical protein
MDLLNDWQKENGQRDLTNVDGKLISLTIFYIKHALYQDFKYFARPKIPGLGRAQVTSSNL